MVGEKSLDRRENSFWGRKGWEAGKRSPESEKGLQPKRDRTKSRRLSRLAVAGKGREKIQLAILYLKGMVRF